MTSRPVYGLILTHFCSNFGIYLFLTQLPSYMNDILKFDIKSVIQVLFRLNLFAAKIEWKSALFIYFFENGGLSALPYLGFWLLTIVSGIVSDQIMQKTKISRTIVRKIFNTIGSFKRFKYKNSLKLLTRYVLMKDLLYLCFAWLVWCLLHAR